MKKYSEPKIVAVTLDPEQAILQVCNVGATGWMEGATTCLVEGGPAGVGSCHTGVRAKQTAVSSVLTATGLRTTSPS